MTIGIKATVLSDMSSGVVVDFPIASYTPTPFENPNFYHLNQYMYTPPPTPPYVYHPSQPPEYTPQTPHLLYYVQPPPRIYTPPFTLTSHTLSTGQSYYAIENGEDRAELQKSEVSSYSVSESPPTLTHVSKHVSTATLMFDESPERVRTGVSMAVATESIHLPIESHVKDVECDIAASDEVGSGIIVFAESKLGGQYDGVGRGFDIGDVEDDKVVDVSVSVLGGTAVFNGGGDASDGSDKEVPKMGLEDEDWVNEKDKDEGFDLFKEADENWSTAEGYQPWELPWDWDDESDVEIETKVEDVGMAVLGGNIVFMDSGDVCDDGEENWDTTEGCELWDRAWDWDSEMEEDSVTEEKEEADDVTPFNSQIICSEITPGDTHFKKLNVKNSFTQSNVKDVMGEDAVKPLLQGWFDKGSRCLAVALMHSYTCPEHEMYVAKLRENANGVVVAWVWNDMVFIFDPGGCDYWLQRCFQSTHILEDKDFLRGMDCNKGAGLDIHFTGIKVVAKWAVDYQKSACDSLKLNHPETQVRNMLAEDFLELLKGCEKLCKLYALECSSRNVAITEKESQSVEPVTAHERSTQGTISKDKKLHIIKNGSIGVVFTNDIAYTIVFTPILEDKDDLKKWELLQMGQFGEIIK